MTSVLVTGGAGYIGSHACLALAEAGYTPVAYDNLSSGHRWAVQWGPFAQGDVADAGLLRRAMREHRIEAVMHFAGATSVPESMADPLGYMRANLAAFLVLLEAMRAEGVGRIVLSSTCAVYGLPTAGELSEEHPLAPVSPYGESKLMAERAVAWCGRAHGMQWTALRYFNAAGADAMARIGESHCPETHLVPLVLDAAERRGAVKVFGTDYATPDGTAVRDYVHVADLAQAHVLALRRLERGGESVALNLGTGRGHSVLEVVAAAEQATGRRIATEAAGRRPGDPPSLVANAAAARSLLGWRPERGLADMVESAWRWHAGRPGARAA